MLTLKQSEILAFIRSYSFRHGLMPTLQEVADEMGVAHRANISKHLSALVEKGYLIRTSGYRGFKLLENDQTTAFALPLAGKIAAGFPIEAIEGQDQIDLYDMLLGPDRYVLKVEGDSMIEAGIFNDDLVIIQQQDTASTGDIVVALIDDQEATLKRLQKRRGGIIELQPANSSMQAMSYEADRVRIQGKLVAQLRSYK
ncbi:MAG: transcriptional repressor LexA [Gammaproteobacteria bacterium]